MRKTTESRIGEKYGMLTIIGLPYVRNQHPYVVCRCDCGNEKIIQIYNLLAKKNMTVSCGCLKESKKILENLEKKEHIRLYKIYHGIKTRCYNTKAIEYKNYGSRGIIMCKEWKNDFKNFYQWALKNGYKDNLSIDRIDVNGNYEPSNCRWVTMEVQANNRRNNRKIEYNGEVHNICEWANIINVKHNTLCMRLDKYHWSIEKALSKKGDKNVK